MSVVVYRDGLLAADTRAYGGPYQTSPGRKTKIYSLDDGARIGITSAVIGMPERFVAWLKAGAIPKEFGEPAPDLRAMLIKPDGKLFLADDGLHFSGPIDSEYYAIGSGAAYAMGAMAMGASADEAVKVACKFDLHCGEPVVVL